MKTRSPLDARALAPALALAFTALAVSPASAKTETCRA
jgi:hypothetical protein